MKDRSWRCSVTRTCMKNTTADLSQEVHSPGMKQAQFNRPPRQTEAHVMPISINQSVMDNGHTEAINTLILRKLARESFSSESAPQNVVVSEGALHDRKVSTRETMREARSTAVSCKCGTHAGKEVFSTFHNLQNSSVYTDHVMKENPVFQPGSKLSEGVGSLLSRLGLENRRGLREEQVDSVHNFSRIDKVLHARISVPSLDPLESELPKQRNEYQGAATHSECVRECVTSPLTKSTSTPKNIAIPLSKEETVQEKERASLCVSRPREEFDKERNKHVSWGTESTVSMTSNVDWVCEQNIKSLNLHDDEFTQGGLAQIMGSANMTGRRDLKVGKLIHPAVQMSGSSERSLMGNVFTTPAFICPSHRKSSLKCLEAPACERKRSRCTPSASPDCCNPSGSNIPCHVNPLAREVQTTAQVRVNSPSINRLTEGLSFLGGEDEARKVHAQRTSHQLKKMDDVKVINTGTQVGKGDAGPHGLETQILDDTRIRRNVNVGAGELFKNGGRNGGWNGSLNSAQIYGKLGDLLEREKTEDEDESANLHESGSLHRPGYGVPEYDFQHPAQSMAGRRYGAEHETTSGVSQGHQTHVGSGGTSSMRALLPTQKLLDAGVHDHVRELALPMEMDCARCKEGSPSDNSSWPEDRKKTERAASIMMAKEKSPQWLQVEKADTRREALQPGYPHDHMALHGEPTSPTRVRVPENVVDPITRLSPKFEIHGYRRATGGSVGLDMGAERDDLIYLVEFVKSTQELRGKARADATVVVQSDDIMEDLLSRIYQSNVCSTSGDDLEQKSTYEDSEVSSKMVDKRVEGGKESIRDTTSPIVQCNDFLRNIVARMALRTDSFSQSFPGEFQIDGIVHGGGGIRASCGYSSANAKAIEREEERDGLLKMMDLGDREESSKSKRNLENEARGDSNKSPLSGIRLSPETIHTIDINAATGAEKTLHRPADMNRTLAQSSANPRPSKIRFRDAGQGASESGAGRQVLRSGSPIADFLKFEGKDQGSRPGDDEIGHSPVKQKMQTSSTTRYPAVKCKNGQSESQKGLLTSRPPFVVPPPSTRSFLLQPLKDSTTFKGLAERDEAGTGSLQSLAEKRKRLKGVVTKVFSTLVAHQPAEYRRLSPSEIKPESDQRLPLLQQPARGKTLTRQLPEVTEDVDKLEETVIVGCHRYLVTGGSSVGTGTLEEATDITVSIESEYPNPLSADARNFGTSGETKGGIKTVLTSTSPAASFHELHANLPKRSNPKAQSPLHHLRSHDKPNIHRTTSRSSPNNRPSPSWQERRQQALCSSRSPHKSTSSNQGSPVASIGTRKQKTSLTKPEFQSAQHAEPSSTADLAIADKSIQSPRIDFPAGLSELVVDESIALAKDSNDPYGDFRESMVEMMEEKNLWQSRDLQDLLYCFLHLNQPVHHRLIHRAFADVCSGQAKSKQSGGQQQDGRRCSPSRHP